ncbi:MAG: hypothetical protein ACTHJJ_19120, partial [Intrasporangium sp.]|uniref:hypothetical protein n=1 Tax=Intrasporangium sp. TaxID=1925024 RepID=UPI003F7D907F
MSHHRSDSASAPHSLKLAEAVRRADPAVVQPDRPRSAEVTVASQLELVAGLDLGDGRWVTVVRDRAGARWTAPLVLADEAVRRAVPGDGVAEALVARLVEAAPTGSAAVVAGATPPSGLGADPALGEFVLTRWAGQPAHGERAISVDQTNESVIVGDAAVVKWCLHLPPAGSTIAHPAARRL